MNRKEITNNVGYAQEKANLEYIRQRQEHGVNDPYMITEIDEAFDAGYDKGYQYAQEYPNWISVKDELPEKDNEFEDYSKLVVVTDGKDFYKGMYNYDGECWLTHDLWPIEDATYWMEVQLPQPPRKEE